MYSNRRSGAMTMLQTEVGMPAEPKVASTSVLDARRW
jgi:hypothetical protein